MEKTRPKMHLPTIDDYFTSQKEREESKLEKIVNINVKDIDSFPNHPFQVNVSEEDELYNSIKEKGVLSPAIVRPKENGKYELISGHRRKTASEMLNLETLPCIVRDLTDDEAKIIMVDSNLQREEILPSEKAFAYKMKLEAIKHQGQRNDLTSSQVATKLENKNSVDVVGELFGDKKDNVYRYIRLTELIPELLKLVDEGRIALNPAVRLSYLTKDEQAELLDFIEFNDQTPSLAQAIQLQNLSKEKLLTPEKIDELLSQAKPNQVPALRISMDKVGTVIPRNLVDDKSRVDYVIKALVFYDKYLKKMHEKQDLGR